MRYWLRYYEKSRLDSFVTHTVIGALHNERQWHIAPSWFKEQERQRQELYYQQERNRIAAEREAREAEAMERYRQHVIRTSQLLRADIDRMEKLAYQCQCRANDIEMARDRTDLSVISRWATVSETGIVAIEALEHLNPENLDGVLRVLSFPYIQEWAYSEHPDLVKALVMDKLVDKSMRQSKISIRAIEAIYVNIISGLKNRKNTWNLWGASSLAIQVHDIMNKIQGKMFVYYGLPLDDYDLQERLTKLREVFSSFQESDGAPISPNGQDTKRLFLSLLCQDMEQIGILSPIPMSIESDTQHYWLYNIFD